MSERGSFARGLPAHAAHLSNADELPSFPSKPDHRPCSRHRKVRHVAREGRCGRERQTAWLFGSSMYDASRAPTEPTWTGASSLARKRIDGSQACPRVGIVLQRSVVEIAAQRSVPSAPCLTAADVVRCVGGSYTSRWQPRTRTSQGVRRPERFE
jgi:hypothetical protein